MIKAVLWDFGGVILSSPFEAFNKYEAEHGLPKDFLRTVNATNPHANAWAHLERNDISAMEFDTAFAAEAEALGHRVQGADVLALLAGDVRDEMVELLDELKASGYLLACLTNNIGATHATTARTDTISAIMSRFDVIVESSKLGVRKPEVQFYKTACDLLGVEPSECVFLDDLGVNLKPAAEMGMKTIKVVSAAQAIHDLHQILA